MLHRSRQEAFRTPFGAVPVGTGVVLRLRLDEGETGPCILRLWTDEGEVRLPMQEEPDGWRRGIVDTSGQPRLIWYWFERLGDWGETVCWYGADGNSLLGEGVHKPHQPESFQITVYDAAYETPSWMRDAAMYQIMVDRFAVGKKGSYLARRDDIVAHEAWNEPPFYAPEGRTQDNKANDFYGGNLAGILEKLPYLRKLGINTLYLNPIFAAHSNHKYDTGDYKAVDPTYGDEDEFRHLCAEAAKLGMRVLLDGVFSHTGEDSRYFNRYGNYPDVGAYQSRQSKYASWYRFERFPDDYECWWGVPTLPNVREEDAAYINYMLTGRDAVVRKWIKRGASGWRLDVADELPDVFLDQLRQSVKKANPDGAVLGEVWEDASNKISYGQMRKYLLGGQLDSVMNYPLRRALIDFLTHAAQADAVAGVMARLQENYPPQTFYSLMNHMGTHDRARIVNRLSGAQEPPREQRRGAKLSPEARALGLERTRAMWLCLCALPGMPALYYADEAGLEGWSDPYNRATYPWGGEDADQLAFVREALRLRSKHAVLRTGRLSVEAPTPALFVAKRRLEDGRDFFGAPVDTGEATDALFALNRGDEPCLAPTDARKKPALATKEGVQRVEGGWMLPPRCAALWLS